jgi:hypothetical protein
MSGAESRRQPYRAPRPRKIHERRYACRVWENPARCERAEQRQLNSPCLRLPRHQADCEPRGHRAHARYHRDPWSCAAQTGAAVRAVRRRRWSCSNGQTPDCRLPGTSLARELLHDARPRRIEGLLGRDDRVLTSWPPSRHGICPGQAASETILKAAPPRYAPPGAHRPCLRMTPERRSSDHPRPSLRCTAYRTPRQLDHVGSAE